MTLEQALTIIAGYLITYIVTSVKNGKLLKINKKATDNDLSAKFDEFQKELAKRDEVIAKQGNELVYYRSALISDLKIRLQMTDDEKERQAILDKLDTLSKFQ